MTDTERPTAAVIISLIAGLFILLGGGMRSMMGSWMGSSGLGMMGGYGGYGGYRGWGGMMGGYPGYGYGMMGGIRFRNVWNLGLNLWYNSNSQCRHAEK
jgi:hypothetical protein